MATVKVLRSLAVEVQPGAVYDDAAMFQLPLTTGIMNQTYTPIEDEAISGNAFKDVPQQGSAHIAGSGLSINLDQISCAPILEACFGAVAGGGPYVYTFPTQNTKMLSMAALDGVNNIKYADVYIPSLTLAGSADSLWAMTIDFLGAVLQDRAATATFPAAPTAFEEPMTFQEAGGTSGYIRIGDAVDDLDSGDNICLEDFNLTLAPNFGEQFANCQRTTLTPLFGATRPECSGSFTVARHSADSFFTWQDAHTPLQAEILIYKSATAQIKIRIPRFVVKAELTDDDTTKIAVEMMIGRNGLGSTYKNNSTGMTFVSPVQVTVTNS